MTARDYRAFAALVKERLDYYRRVPDPDAVDVCIKFAEGMAAIFAADNVAFNRPRFMLACGLTVYSKKEG